MRSGGGGVLCEWKKEWGLNKEESRENKNKNHKNRKTEKQKNRKTEKQKNRKTEKHTTPGIPG